MTYDFEDDDEDEGIDRDRESQRRLGDAVREAKAILEARRRNRAAVATPNKVAECLAKLVGAVEEAVSWS